MALSPTGQERGTGLRVLRILPRRALKFSQAWTGSRHLRSRYTSSPRWGA